MSAQPGSCPELEQGGCGARSHDRFMFRLQLHWPHTKSQVWHTYYILLPLEPGEAWPGPGGQGLLGIMLLPPALDHLCSGGALRAVPLFPHFPAPVLLRQGQPGATSSRKPSQGTSSLPGKGVYLVVPEVPGRDLDPAFSVQMTLRTSGFSLTLPCLSFPLWEGSVFTHRGWN